MRYGALHVTSTMDGYTKLHAVILDSSIWLEPTHVRIVWITMLAMADATGIVEASARGLAARARVTDEECREALHTLSSPDPDSRDGTTGERIRQEEPGVWFVINHEKYRERQTRRQALTAARVQRHRMKQDDSVTCNDVTLGNGAKRAPVYVSVCGADASASSERGESAREENHPFDVFWLAYDKKVGRAASERAWKRARIDDRLFPVILEATKAYVAVTPDKAFRRHPATWLNQRGWEDEIVQPGVAAKRKQPAEPPRNVTLSALPQAVIHDPDDPACECERCYTARRRAAGYGEQVKA